MNVVPFSDGLDPLGRCYARVRDATLLNAELEPAQVLGVLELVKFEILRNLQSHMDSGT